MKTRNNTINLLLKWVLAIFFAVITIVACDQINDDVLEAPEAVSEIVEFTTKIDASVNQPGILGLDSVANSIEFEEFNVFLAPSFGAISFTDDNMSLLYIPAENTQNQSDGFIIDALNVQEDILSRIVVDVVISAESDDDEPGELPCESDIFTEGRLSVKTDSIFVVNLLDNKLLCDLPRQGSRAVKITPIQHTEGLNIHVSPSADSQKEEAWLTYIPPEGFTGEVKFIYEMCWGFHGKGCDDIFECDTYPDVCAHSINTEANILVEP